MEMLAGVIYLLMLFLLHTLLLSHIYDCIIANGIRSKMLLYLFRLLLLHLIRLANGEQVLEAIYSHDKHI